MEVPRDLFEIWDVSEETVLLEEISEPKLIH
jgi:hypothetical protein